MPEQKPLSKPLVVLLVLCGLDLLLTTVELYFGLAVEANPVMREMTDTSLSSFIITKIALTILSCSIFYIRAEHRLTRISVYVLIVIYGLVLTLHGIGLHAHFSS